MNVTLSANDDLIRRARALAGRQGKSLNQVFREYLRALVSQDRGDDPTGELFALMDEAGGDLKGKRVVRDDLYE